MRMKLRKKKRKMEKKIEKSIMKRTPEPINEDEEEDDLDSAIEKTTRKIKLKKTRWYEVGMESKIFEKPDLGSNVVLQVLEEEHIHVLEKFDFFALVDEPAKGYLYVKHDVVKKGIIPRPVKKKLIKGWAKIKQCCRFVWQYTPLGFFFVTDRKSFGEHAVKIEWDIQHALVPLYDKAPKEYPLELEPAVVAVTE